MGKTILLVVIMLGLFIPADAQETPDASLRARAQQLIRILNEPKDFDEMFAKSLLAVVKPAQIVQTANKFKSDYGRALSIESFEKKSGSSANVGILYEKDVVLTFLLVVDPADEYKITGLQLVSVDKVGVSFETVIDDLKKLPGKTSFIAARLKDKEFAALAKHNEEEHLAIGSTFKLYILAELARQVQNGDRKWSDVVDLSYVSLPTGQLQNFEKGSPLTLHTLASLMISTSDNTATDQLLFTLGRDSVEKMLSITGHSKPERSIPFLATSEMFMLKGLENKEFANRYVSGDSDARRKILKDELSKFGVNDIPTEGFLTKPTLISEIEWFASASDLARLMNWLRLNTEKPPVNKARGVMTINKGLAKSVTDKWDYIGFKGGSEPGVISLTFLLKSKKGEWFVVSSSWNDQKSAVNELNLFC